MNVLSYESRNINIKLLQITHFTCVVNKRTCFLNPDYSVKLLSLLFILYSNHSKQPMLLILKKNIPYDVGIRKYFSNYCKRQNLKKIQHMENRGVLLNTLINT